MHNILSHFIDFKLTLLGAWVILFNAIAGDVIYKVVMGGIFLGYNLHRWWILYKNDKRNNQNPSNETK